MVLEISLTKNLERKKKGQTQGRTNRRVPICNPMIQLVVVDLYTKYEVSILNGCGDIFDEKFGKKEKGTNIRKNTYEKAHLQSHDTTCPCGPDTKYKVSILNGCGDIFDEKFGKKEKWTNTRKNK